MKHTDIINSLNLEQKCALLSGGTVFTTRAALDVQAGAQQHRHALCRGFLTHGCAHSCGPFWI